MTSAKPDALERWNDLCACISASGVAVFLDYDGTLTPIAPRPELAVLSPSMRSTLRLVAKHWPTAIVTGRSLDQIQRLVDLSGLTYAASHGFDIHGPGLQYQVGRNARNAIHAACFDITQKIADVEGVLIENKTFSVAVHFRLVAPENTQRVIDATRSTGLHHRLRVTGGKQVIELRPDIDWDKGAAIRWLAGRHPGRIPLFIGDDLTDEDGFRAIADNGISILVAAEPRETAARFTLRDVDAVETFLQLLCRIPAEPDR